MKKLVSLILMLVCLTTAYAYNSPNNDLGAMLNKTFKVEGGAGIVQFATALDDVLPIEMEIAEVDRQNGYINYQFEGDGGYFVKMAVWNRQDGKKLFVVSYLMTESMTDEMKPGPSTDCHFSRIVDTDHGPYLYDLGYRAYLYDAASSMLRPTDLNVSGEGWNGDGTKPCRLILPRKGKDIEVVIGIGEDIETRQLKWNGMGWTYEAPFLLEVFIHDKTYPVNVRKAPGGDVVDKLQKDDMIYVDRCENGWFHIGHELFYHVDEEQNYTYKGDKWVHRSVVLVGWAGSAERKLLALPAANAAVVFRGHQGSESAGEQIAGLLDIKNGYVKVKLANDKAGWVEASDLCGNSLTTCP